MNGGEEDALVLRGTLTERPLARLLYFLFRKKLTGRLALFEESGDKSIVFLREGQPVHADRPNGLDRLDRVIADTGAVTPGTLEEAEAARAASGRRLGDVLSNMGVPRSDVAVGLKEQLRRKLHRLFFQQKGRFDVFRDDHVFGRGADFAETSLDPRLLILSGIKAAYDEARLDRELAPIAGKTVRINGAAAGDLEEFGLADDDQPLIAALAGEGARVELLTRVGGRPFDAKALLLTLLYADLIEIRGGAHGRVTGAHRITGSGRVVATPAAGQPAAVPEAGRGSGQVAAPAFGRTIAAAAMEPVAAVPRVRSLTSGAPPSSGVAPGAGARPVPSGARRGVVLGARRAEPSAPAAPQESREAIRARVKDMAGRLDQMNHFELLGVPESASAEELNRAFLTVVKQYHPDRMRALGLEDLRPDLERIMSRASEASALLADGERRDEYLKTMRFSAADRARAMAALDAELAYQRGDALLKKGDFVGAEQAFKQAVDGNPDEPEHRALWTWARFCNPALGRDRMAAEAVPILTQAVNARPRFARGHFFLGEIWKFRRDMGKAQAAYKAALTADPSYYEAQRELRVLQMKKDDDGAGGKGGSGLFGMFKKK